MSGRGLGAPSVAQVVGLALLAEAPRIRASAPTSTPEPAPAQTSAPVTISAPTPMPDPREPAWRLRLRERRAPLPRAGDRGIGPYVGINLLAPLTAIRSPAATTYIAFLSDLESGLALQGGYLFDSWQALDARFSVGPTSSLYTQWQLHVGYDFYVLDLVKVTHKGLYVGPQLRLWDMVHGAYHTHDFSFVPAVHLGYRVEIRGFYFDFRITQTLAAVSWSTRPGTGVGAGPMFSVYPSFLPVIPTLGISFGYRFGGRGL